MPKINIYVPDEMLEWMRENDISQSAEFQERIRQIQDGEVEATDGEPRELGQPGKVALVRVDTDGSFRLRRDQHVIGHHIKGERVTRLVVIE